MGKLVKECAVCHRGKLWFLIKKRVLKTPIANVTMKSKNDVCKGCASTMEGMVNK